MSRPRPRRPSVAPSPPALHRPGTVAPQHAGAPVLRPARLCIAARDPERHQGSLAPRGFERSICAHRHLSHALTPQARPGRDRAQARLLADQPAVRVYLDRGRRSPGARPPWRSSMPRRLPRHRGGGWPRGQRAIDGARRSTGCIDGVRRSSDSSDGEAASARKKQATVDDTPECQVSRWRASCIVHPLLASS